MRKLLFCLILCANAAYIYAQGPAIRSQKFMGEASLTASLAPNFALHDKEMLQFGVGFGWNATRYLYLGAGASWIQYFSDASALPVYLNPRLYFANKPDGSGFIDFRAGSIVYAPDNVINGEVVHADRKFPIYAGLGIGHLFSHVSASLGVDIYPALNETDKITKGVGGYPCACMYFRMAYHF